MIQAKTIAMSFNEETGTLLTTMEVTMHRFILPEFNTHRAFSRNASSSRAIPLSRRVEQVRKNPALPAFFGEEQRGMVAENEVRVEHKLYAQDLLNRYSNDVCDMVEKLSEVNLHKQISSRYLEPFSWQTVIVTSTTGGYRNFFNQRIHPSAQPEMRILAEKMHEAMGFDNMKTLDFGEWHLPYIDDDEELSLEDAMKVSVARCARVSYLNQNKKDVKSDLELFERLISSDPPHLSPFEHVATPYVDGLSPMGNFITWHKDDEIYKPRGWAQLRHNLDILDCNDA